MNLYLIGYRCSGKTTVGRLLAERFGLAFVDTDEEVMQRVGGSISDMVARHGWPFFRDMEQKVIRDISGRNNVLAATGGGVVLNGRNVRWMTQSGHLVWLKASSETIRDRMARDRNTEAIRPGLTDAGAFQEIAAVLRERQPLYEKAASQTVETDGRSIESIVAETGSIWEKIKNE